MPVVASPTAIAAGDPAPVIVILRDQHPDLKPKAQARQRDSAVAADQAPLLDSLRAAGAVDIHQLTTVNAVAAKVGPAEVARLRADPRVAGVQPDRFIPLPARPFAAGSSGRPGGRSPAAATPPCGDAAKPLAEPEALDLTHTESADPGAPQAHALATGKGVKIALLADGIDVANPEFRRPDGSPVIFDYQDFSGDGTADDSGGAEAFGDASALAAQGSRTYDPAKELPSAGLPAACAFRIRGFAPDASVAAIKVFGQYGTTESAFVRGIDYAVNHDAVDVLSESFGENQVPDTGLSPISLANAAAVRAGVTVVSSSGDSGRSGTIGSPATDSDVIAVGATTSYRLHAQAKGYPGYVSDNIAALSSGGATQRNKYVDLVAPGMTGMAACTVGPKWSDCKSATEVFGGSSQAAPFAAGAAALVIQAYRDTHGGLRPSPAVVRRLLTGTATDLGAPADEQGAGRLDSYAAVRAARSLDAGGYRAADAGSALIPSVTQLNLTGSAGEVQRASVTLTNTADVPQTVVADSRALGAKTFGFGTTVQVTGTTPAPPPAPVGRGGPGENLEAAPSFTFDVPSGTPWLTTELHWPGTRDSGQLTVELFDPAGRLVQESYDYGFVNYQSVDVHDPAAGRWTAKILWNNGRGHFAEPLPAAGSYRGPVTARVTGYRWASAGVRPVTHIIPAGGSAGFDLAVPLPADAGDAPASLQFSSDRGTHLSVPVARQVLLPVDGRSFHTTVTGGVGRDLNHSQSLGFDVPAGKKNVAVDLTMPDPHTQVYYYLVNPEGQVLAGDTNVIGTPWDAQDGTGTTTASPVANHPMPGRWKLLIWQDNAYSGTRFDEQVTGVVRFDTARVTATDLPDDPAHPVDAAHPVTATVTVTNTGVAGTYFYLDPRLAGETDVPMTPISGNTSVELPTDRAEHTSVPVWLVPTHTSALTETVHADVPVDVDLYAVGRTPAVLRTAGAKDVTARVQASQLAFGWWITEVGSPGPFAGTAPKGKADFVLSARTRAIDPSVTSSTGDFWAQSTGGPEGDGLFVPAGATATITVTVKPTAAPGTVVRGTLFVGQMNQQAGVGSELTEIPYAYQVAKG